MNLWKKRIGGLLALALCTQLCGCMMTVDQMYVPPRRSESYLNLQAVMDEAMTGLDYCAPLNGENQQSVQMVDLTGDGTDEAVLYARGTDEHPLKVFVFTQEEEQYRLLSTIESTGSAFDQVEYAQMDGEAGYEMILGRQVSDQVLRNVTVYRFAQGQPEQMMSVNYRKFLSLDLDSDGLGDLFVLRPGQEPTDCGVVELYSMAGGTTVRSAEVGLSQPADQLKRIMTGALHGGTRAVYVASTVDQSTIVTDVYAIVQGRLTNVSVSNESGTGVKTVRNYYVYADDIDQDGELELPALIPMRSPDQAAANDREHLIRWYALTADGGEVDKRFTYHNYLDGWYLELSEYYVSRLCVIPVSAGHYSFCLWEGGVQEPKELWSVFTLTGDERSAEAVSDDRFLLTKTETVAYAARISDAGAALGITRDDLTDAFFLIQKDWKTGEM